MALVVIRPAPILVRIEVVDRRAEEELPDNV
jgi:hypothetical protein